MGTTTTASVHVHLDGGRWPPAGGGDCRAARVVVKKLWRPTRAKSWIGNPFLWGIVVVMIVLGVTLYGVSKTVTDAAAVRVPPRCGFRRCSARGGKRRGRQMMRPISGVMARFWLSIGTRLST